MTQRIPRRDLLKSAAAVGAGLFLGGTTPVIHAAANEKINLAFIGIGGRGSANLGSLHRVGENVVALCDVDDVRAGKAYERHGKARKFKDFRSMFDAMEKQIDAVVVSTPDHTHFHPSMIALGMGKHLYCEKPMAHSIWEVRQMTELARKQKVATQLGVQRHTISNVHRVVELIKAGTIGTIKEVHSWIGGTRGMPRVPADRPAVPAHLDWDLWQGPVASRPYHPTYCPYGWRFWWDYGTGETGNWGCHILDIPFWALDLDHPVHVSGSGPPVHGLTTPRSMATHMRFPGAATRGPAALVPRGQRARDPSSAGAQSQGGQHPVRGHRRDAPVRVRHAETPAAIPVCRRQAAREKHSRFAGVLPRVDRGDPGRAGGDLPLRLLRPADRDGAAGQRGLPRRW